MYFQVPQSEFLLSFLIQTLSLSCSFLNLFFDCPFFFFCLPKKVVFSFMFGSILSLNSPIYFTSQLINQDYQLFFFFVSIKATWVCGFTTSALHSSFTFWVPLCGHCPVDHFCEVSALLWLSCVDTHAMRFILAHYCEY